MELMGSKVKHAVYGIGEIKKCTSNYITVEFPTKTSKFIYPDAFEKFVEAEDADVQAAIIKKINDAKAAEEQKRLAEEAARRVAVEELNTATITHSASKKLKSLDEKNLDVFKVGDKKCLLLIIMQKSWPDSLYSPISRWRNSSVFALPGLAEE